MEQSTKFHPAPGSTRLSNLHKMYQSRYTTKNSLTMGRKTARNMVAHGHQICIKYTKADVRLRTPDDGQKGCPKYVDL